MEIKYGRKLIEGLTADELRPPVCLVTVAGDKERALATVMRPHAVAALSGMEQGALDSLAAKCTAGGTVLGFGGDAAMEAARYAAWKSGAALVLAPTTITGESLVRADVLVRAKGGREKAGTKDAYLLLVDYGLIWEGGEADSRSSVGHVLSIVTAVEDARRAAAGGGEAYDEEKGLAAMDIVAALTDRADDIYDLTEAGIRTLVELLLRREEFAQRDGSRRLVEGSEHVFADCAESVLGRALPRGPLLCLAVVMMMELQKKPSKPVKQFLHWIGAGWKPEAVGVTEPELARVLGSLPAFERSGGYAPTAIRGAELSGPEIKRIIEGMKEPILRSSLQERKD
jgi:glycerol dehydrogenase-like iron-containing ADH family enzyme